MSKEKAASPVAEAQSGEGRGEAGSEGSIRRQAILVLGMHRSGTSAMSGALVRLGMTPPRTLMPATADNPRGYWESQALMQCHERLLSAAGSHWADWRSIDHRWFRSEAADSCRQELKDLVLREFDGVGPFVVKDPRICRFVPFWLETLRDLAIEPRIILVLRNPLEVAASLEARDGFRSAEAQLLWLRHMLDAERATRHLPRSIVRYRDLISNWRSVIADLTDNLKGALPAEIDGKAVEVDDFLAGGLRHHRVSNDELEGRSGVLSWTASAYAALDALAVGDDAMALDRLDAVSRDFELVAETLLGDGGGAAPADRLALRKKDKALGALKRDLKASRARQWASKRLLDARQRDVIQLYHSTSWRVSYPLRLLSHGYKRTLAALKSAIRSGGLPGKKQGRQGKTHLPIDVVDERGEGIEYSKWVATVDALDHRDRLLIARHITAMADIPRISIVLSVDHPSISRLRASIEAVTEQLYHEWELWLIVDPDMGADVGKGIDSLLEDYAGNDQRIRKLQLSRREPQSGMKQALAKATGRWLMSMASGDRLSEHALYLFAERAVKQPEATIVYADEDRIDAEGRRLDPWFKPDWDYDLFLGKNFVNRAAIFRMDVVRAAGGFQQDHVAARLTDLTARILEVCPAGTVEHVPFVLYHDGQRMPDEKDSDGGGGRDSAEAVAAVIRQHFQRTGQAATAIPEGHGLDCLIRRELPAELPRVSIVIPTRDQYRLLKPCIDGLLHRTAYEAMELVVIDNGTTEPEALALLSELNERENVRVLRDDGPFNFSRLVNRGVAASSGDICVLLNNDVDVINPGWLKGLVSHAIRPEVGAVGAKLYYGDDTLQHGGVIIGMGGIASHVHKAVPRHAGGYFNRLNLTHRLSCVTGACLAVSRELYDRLGGFNDRDLGVSFNDVDFCLRVGKAGYRVLWTPQACLYHYESVSRGRPRATPEKAARHDREKQYIRRYWRSLLKHDPYYNPNLSLKPPGFKPAASPGVIKPWYTCRR